MAAKPQQESDTVPALERVACPYLQLNYVMNLKDLTVNTTFI